MYFLLSVLGQCAEGGMVKEFWVGSDDFFGFCTGCFD
jgi:hypothetical protein